MSAWLRLPAAHTRAAHYAYTTSWGVLRRHIAGVCLAPESVLRVAAMHLIGRGVA